MLRLESKICTAVASMGVSMGSVVLLVVVAHVIETNSFPQI